MDDSFDDTQVIEAALRDTFDRLLHLAGRSHSRLAQAALNHQAVIVSGVLTRWADAHTTEISGTVSHDEAEHEAHKARGENHWFTCGLCDDETPEG